jgi:triacylglycerol esterase/lipase EstA (alpha/beta hydrolase family)
MVTFLLVHGTFAPGAEWTAPRSLLQRTFEDALRAKNESAAFEPVDWSGRNLTRDRLIAADKIAVKINAVRADSPNAKIFLIGHSHGGSAISFF